MARLDLLESFDAGRPTAEGPAGSWQEGHAAGLAEGRAQALAEGQSLREAVVARIEDMRFTHAEAQAHVLQALGPLFDALIDRVLPGLQGASTVLHLRHLLTEAARRDAEAPLVLRLSAPEAEALGADLDLGPSVRIEADPGLAEGEAVLSAPPAVETALDVPALIEAACATLSAHADHREERTDHG